MIEGLLDGDVVAASADHHSELELPVVVVPASGQDHVVVGTTDGGAHTGPHVGLAVRLALIDVTRRLLGVLLGRLTGRAQLVRDGHLDDVSAIVGSCGVELTRPGDRRQRSQ